MTYKSLSTSCSTGPGRDLGRTARARIIPSQRTPGPEVRHGCPDLVHRSTRSV